MPRSTSPPPVMGVPTTAPIAPWGYVTGTVARLRLSGKFANPVAIGRGPYTSHMTNPAGAPTLHVPLEGDLRRSAVRYRIRGKSCNDDAMPIGAAGEGLLDCVGLRGGQSGHFPTIRSRNTYRVQQPCARTFGACWGYLNFRSTPQAKYPLMLILHSSGGIHARDWFFAHTLNEMGIATVVLDSFRPRTWSKCTRTNAASEIASRRSMR
jgi:hypothetical protein